MTAPLIALFTDFGLEGPYVGQMKAVLAHQSPGIPVVDLMHDAPAFDIESSAYLLAALAGTLPERSVLVGVVDPGVGTRSRKPVIVRADGRWFVGPGNGLFNVLAARAQDTAFWDIDWRPQQLSISFHGRDLFAPVAAMIARGDDPPGTSALPSARLLQDWPDDLWRIVYIDRFGNAATGVRAATLTSGDIVEARGTEFPHARVFGEADPRRGFWYENSIGLIELALREGSAANRFDLSIGNEILRGEP
jgi:hypothetical protein